MYAQFVTAVRNASIYLPVGELCLLMLVIAPCLALKHNRVGLVAAYVFAYKWGWTYFTNDNSRFIVAYLVFGCLTGVLTVLNALRSPAQA